MSVLVSGPRRVFVMLRLQRVLCGRLVGLHLVVLAPDGRVDVGRRRP